MLTITEKRKVCKMLRERFDGVNIRNIKFSDDGAVTATVDKMPNTNQPGRIFTGWDTELLQEANR